jgi:putative ABC transport system ATP-binding protein
MGLDLTVTGLGKVYGSGELAVSAVRDVTFSAKSGELISIIGSSGSGKTTLLAMIGGLLAVTTGSIIVNGEDLAQASPRRLTQYRRESVGFVFQANNLIPFLTARENLLLAASIAGNGGSPARRRADELLEALGLTPRAKGLVTRLSGGERQRVGIARAFMNDPHMVLVDEPTANLDSVRGKQVVQMLIAEVKTRHKLGVMVTHDKEMAALADRVLVLHDGQLVQDIREGQIAS